MRAAPDAIFMGATQDGLGLAANLREKLHALALAFGVGAGKLELEALGPEKGRHALDLLPLLPGPDFPLPLGLHRHDEPAGLTRGSESVGNGLAQHAVRQGWRQAVLNTTDGGSDLKNYLGEWDKIT